MNTKARFAITLFLLIVQFFVVITPAQAAEALYVKSSRAPGVYYSDTTLYVSLYGVTGSVIVYTTNGTTPSARYYGTYLSISNGTRYTGSIPVSGKMTIKAVALKLLHTTSPVASFSYEVYKPTQLGNAVLTKFGGFNYNNYASIQTYTAQDGSTGSFSKTYTGITPGTVNCTWYTFVRIRYNLGRKVLFSSAGGLNGRYWYGKIVANTQQVKYSGSTGLENLISTNKNRPVYNIVVSFERNGSGTAGHVMLIDAIINGKVYYSDNSRPGAILTKNSISEFKSAYSSYNGNIVGVVHLK